MLGDKSCLLVPWQVDNEKFVKKVMDKNINCPIAIGHFEINGFNLNSSKVCDFGIPPDVFFDNYELTFSGHFHKRTIMKRDESKIIYTGNTYELTRADLGQPKGFCVLDTETMKYEFINNDVSIKHKKFEYPEKFSKEDIEGNIIDVIVDIGDDHDEGKFQSYMLTIDSYKPYDVDLKLLNNIDVHSKDDYKVQNTEELIENYISDVDIGNDKIKTSVNKKMQKLYKQCKQDG
jgi:DNA repair exonuclease SbcCD nuclease subunit